MMSRFQGVANLLRKKVMVKLPEEKDGNIELIESELVLRYLKVDHFAKLAPFMDSKEKDDSISPEQLMAISSIVKELIIETEDFKDLTQEDLDAIVSLNFSILIKAFTNMVQSSVGFMNPSDKKKALEKLNPKQLEETSEKN